MAVGWDCTAVADAFVDVVAEMMTEMVMMSVGAEQSCYFREVGDAFGRPAPTACTSSSSRNCSANVLGAKKLTRVLTNCRRFRCSMMLALVVVVVVGGGRKGRRRTSCMLRIIWVLVVVVVVAPSWWWCSHDGRRPPRRDALFSCQTLFFFFSARISLNNLLLHGKLCCQLLVGKEKYFQPKKKYKFYITFSLCLSLSSTFHQICKA